MCSRTTEEYFLPCGMTAEECALLRVAERAVLNVKVCAQVVQLLNIPSMSASVTVRKTGRPLGV